MQYFPNPPSLFDNIQIMTILKTHVKRMSAYPYKLGNIIPYALVSIEVSTLSHEFPDIPSRICPQLHTSLKMKFDESHNKDYPPFYHSGSGVSFHISLYISIHIWTPDNQHPSPIPTYTKEPVKFPLPS